MDQLSIATAGGIALGLAVTPTLAVKFSERVLDEDIADDKLKAVSRPVHLPAFALLATVGTAFVLTHTAYSSMSLALVAFVLLCVPMVLIDLVDFIIPNEISYGALGVAVLGLALAPTTHGAGDTFPFLGSVAPQADILNGSLQGMAAMTILYAILHLIGSDFGMGDVKLSASSGLLLGAFGWQYVIAGFFATFLSAIVLSLLAKSAAEGKASADFSIAFGPYILLGTLLAFPFAPVLVDFYNSISV